MVAALLASLLLAHPSPGGAAVEAVGLPVSKTEVYRDGTNRVAAQRQPDGRVRLTWPDGRFATAGIGPHAIAHLPASAKRASDLGDLADLIVVRPLMASADLYLVRSARPSEDGLALAARLADTLDITPDLALARRFAFTPPADDPRRGGQWYLDTIGIDTAWAQGVGDPSVVIGVVDNGCDTAHPDLAANMLSGLDLVDNDDDPGFQPNGNGNEHGTACAGIIAAVGDNGVGIAGVCPTCRLRCVRLLPDNGTLVALSADINAFAEQLEWNVAVSSNSWGFVDYFPVPLLLRMAIEDLMSDSRGGLGAIVVFAAGNDHREIYADELYGIPGVLTVGAINAFDEAAQFSNYGPVVDLVAPTGSLTTDISGPDGAHESDYTPLFGGTSAAAPVVAGVAALLIAAAPDRPALELSDLLVRTVRPAPFAVPDEAGHDTQYGFGIVDPTAALAEILTPVGPVEPGEPGPDSDSEPTPEPDPEPAAEDVEQPSEQPRDDGGCTHGGPVGLVLGGLAIGLIALRRNALKA